jgi:protein TonB
MKTQSEHIQRWDDIIFDKRNKAYGAYAMRKNYDDHVLIGWSISFGVVALIFLSSFLSIGEPEIITTTPTGCQFPMPPPVVTPNQKVAPSAPAPKQVNRNLPPVLTQNDPPEPKPVDPVQPSNPGVTVGTQLPVDGTLHTGVDPGNVPEPPKPSFVLHAEVMPAYEGGMEAMMKFLQKKLRYPSSAQEQKEEGTVYVSFIISATGEVTNIEIIKGFYKDCDKEAARVISLMNKWKPGLQNKMPVAVKMVLPIKFKLEH